VSPKISQAPTLPKGLRSQEALCIPRVIGS